MHNFLLVEDNNDDALYLLRQFKMNGLREEVLHLTTSEEALSYLTSLSEDQYPKVIIVDLNLPGMDGIVFARTVRSLNKVNAIPIVILTHSIREKVKVDATQLGIYTQLIKPIDQFKLIRIIDIAGIKMQELLKKIKS